MKLFKSIMLTSLIVFGLQEANAADLTTASYATVSNNLDGSIGKSVRWFGRIVQVNTLAPQDLKIVVNQVPQSEPNVPMSTKYSEGRFMVRVGFPLDTLAFKSESMISIVGSVTGTETRTLGNTTQTIPVIKAIQVGLWHSQLPVEPYRCRSTMSNNGRNDDTYTVACDNDGYFWKQIKVANQTLLLSRKNSPKK